MASHLRLAFWLSTLAASVVCACATFHGSDGPEDPDAGAGDASGNAPADATAFDAAPDARTQGMVLIHYDGGSFYIDARETSVDEYNRVVGANSWATLAPKITSSCSFHSNWSVRGAGCSGVPTINDAPNLPVNCVDWCDALAYCTAQGKRLCGGLGGRDLTGPTLDAEIPRPDVDEWMLACGGPDAQTYPYGSSFAGGRCVVDGGFESTTASTSCEGYFQGVFDLVGSVAEWENGCLSDARAELCSGRGGNYRSYSASTCPVQKLNLPRQGQFDDVGIRCCADP